MQVRNKRGTNEALSVLSDGINDEIEEAAPQKSKHLRHAGDVDILNLTDNDAVSTVPSHVEDMTDNRLTECEGSITTSAPTVSQWLDDVAIQDTTTANIKIHQEDKTLDVSAFFSKLYGHKLKDGKTRNVRDCEACKKKGRRHQRVAVTLHIYMWILIVNGALTITLHSILPSDVKDHKTAAAIASAQQTSIRWSPHRAS
ncbi:hypothetical protein DFH29DRAFT_997826 [Suillus ampliporus]|nr:hypothetical protein DFH29DRAFT_997826 [Suillus ampliporus]